MRRSLGVGRTGRPTARCGGYDVRLEVHGAKVSIAVGLDDRLPLRSVEPGVTFPAGVPHSLFMDRFADAFRAELVAFTEVVAGNRSSPCTIADALEAGWIAEAATLSLHEHRPVAVAEVRAVVQRLRGAATDSRH